MICSSAGIIASPPSRPKRLEPGYLTSKKPSKPFGLDELAEDGALALLGELDLLVGALDALLDPGLLGRVGDMHELEADRAAIGAAQDRQHLAHGGEFEPEHVVDENLAVVVGLVEAVGARDAAPRDPSAARGPADRDWRADGRACDRRGSSSARAPSRGSRGGSRPRSEASAALPRPPWRAACRRPPSPSPASRRRAR